MQRDELATAVSAVYKAAKAAGLDVPTLRKTVAARRVPIAERQAADKLLAAYLRVLDEPRDRRRRRGRLESGRQNLTLSRR